MSLSVSKMYARIKPSAILTRVKKKFDIKDFSRASLLKAAEKHPKAAAGVAVGGTGLFVAALILGRILLMSTLKLCGVD